MESAVQTDRMVWQPTAWEWRDSYVVTLALIRHRGRVVQRRDVKTRVSMQTKGFGGILHGQGNVSHSMNRQHASEPRDLHSLSAICDCDARVTDHNLR